ncbi:MAG: hypothetical protein IJ609_01000 [Paludibacteraceae bacterium]|nr:hypothetical protein [Paludibacteraceae bacterium]
MLLLSSHRLSAAGWLVCLLIVCLPAAGQSSSAGPKRTAEEFAGKQTERMVRDLGITDSRTCDTLYKMHLKYARVRMSMDSTMWQQCHDSIFRLMNSELRGIITPEQYEQFVQHVKSHRAHQSARLMAPQRAESVPIDAERRRQPLPTGRQP